MFQKIKDRIGWNWLFLIFILIIFFWIWIFNFSLSKIIFTDFINFFIKLLPVLFLVYFFIFIFSFVLETKKIKNFLENWWFFTKLFFSVFWWILSSGPLYLWYPLLKDLKNKWLTDGHIASFVYARAIKIPMIFLMISYFSLKFTIIFNVILFFLAFLIWPIFNILINKLWKK